MIDISNYKKEVDYVYDSFVKTYHKNFTKNYERCFIEEYRNMVSKHFKIPSGHRWKYDEWFTIQEYAMELLVNGNYITNESKKFYCLKIKF